MSYLLDVSTLVALLVAGHEDNVRVLDTEAKHPAAVLI